MTHVTFTGAADDGQHLIVTTPDGQELALPVTDELRAAVRHANTASQRADAAVPSRPGLSPKEIQQRIRAGLSAAELAELTGASHASLEKYEAPVLAERAYVAELARSTRIGADTGAPVLGDLVTDRLASRGIDPLSLAWDAWREPDQPWNVCVDFRADTRQVRALWEFDHTSRSVTALNEEARWLSETELLDVPIPQRHLASVKSADPTLSADRDLNVVALTHDRGAPEVTRRSTEELLDSLADRRGSRETVDLDSAEEDEDFEGFGPSAKPRTAEVGFVRSPGAMPHPAGSARRTGEIPLVDTPTQDAASAPPDGEPVARKRTAKRGRASVPSWDEIVFGAKHE